jgi:outer membrane cobalamin receptor
MKRSQSRGHIAPTLVLTTCFFGSGSALAATADDSLEEVQISSNRLEETLPQSIEQYGTRVDTITREDYANLAFVDVAEGLQALVPTLFVLPKNGPFDYADISLLGSRSSDVLWLVDGVRVNNRLYGGTLPIDTLPAAMVERVETLDGGQALFYGTSAVAGAINVVTKSFTDSPDGSLTFGTDTDGARRLNGYFSDSLNGHHFVVYGSTDRSDGYQTFRNQDYQPSAMERDRHYSVQTIGLKYDYEIAGVLRSSATYQHTDADLDFAFPYQYQEVNRRKEDLATAKIDYTLNDRLSLFVKTYYHQWHTHVDTLGKDLAVPGQINVLGLNQFWGYDDRGVNALAKVALLPGLDAFVGYDLQKYGGRDEVLLIEPNKELTQAAFGQLRLSPELIPRTHLSFGFRYNHPDVGEQSTVWNVTGQYDFTQSLFARTTLGTNFRLPSAEELFANDPLDERGNPNLKPEKSRSINASVGGNLQQLQTKVRWEIIGFARDIHDLIDITSTDPVTEQGVFGNTPSVVKVRGAEATLQAAVASDLSFDLSYTYSRSHDEDGQQTQRIPQQVGKILGDYHPDSLPFGASVALSYTGKVYRDVIGEHYEYGKYAVVDLAGRYFFDSERKHRLVLGLENVFDKQYGSPAVGCTDQPDGGCDSPYIAVNRGVPRTLRATYTYAFK